VGISFNLILVLLLEQTSGLFLQIFSTKSNLFSEQKTNLK
jgi:hypothetical protein